MSVQVETVPYRHALDVPGMGAAVRIARETTELVLVEYGVGLRHPSVGPALPILAEPSPTPSATRPRNPR